MRHDETRKKLNEYFISKLDEFGATSKGVDYNDPEVQAQRFGQLTKIIDSSSPFTVIDYGSGYGALFDFLFRKGWQFEYYGVDLVDRMVIAGRDLYRDYSNAHFTTDENELPKADYLIAGSIFNLKLDESYEQWQNYVSETLMHMNALCSRGFSFNMLTKYSDFDRMEKRPDLFFGDPLYFFDYCKRNFSRNVALLHDYGLYDFTILVRKEI